mmetsp:Transcript_28980/g.51821  ORF Transcript_28980/g.51821 Transcript_28980/m.51821 type:complete len:212 (-) Transcript_28980:35-670(-)
MVDSQLSEYMAKAETAYEQAVSALNDMSGWTKVIDTPEVVMSSRPSPTGFHSIKGEFFVDKPAQRVVKWVFDNWQTILNDHPVIEEAEVIHTFNDDAKVLHYMDKGAAIVAPRELTTFYLHLQIDDTTFVNIGTHVDIPGFVKKPDAVHAETNYIMHLAKPVGGDVNKTHLSVILLADPKGSIPAAVANSIVSRHAEFAQFVLNKIKEQVA